MGLYLEGELPRIEPKQDLIQIFVDHCCKSLEIGDDYDIYIVDDRESHGIQTTAYYDLNNKIIKIYAKDRAVPDVLRSIAHELVHAKQDVKGEFDEHPMQHVGGYLEDDANARAGSLIKGFALDREEDDVYEIRKQFQNLILEDVHYRLEDLEDAPTLAEIKSTIQQSVQEALTAGAKAEIKSKRDVYAKTPAGQTAIYLSVIKVLEQGLKSLGYKVDVDGKFDQKTEDAIKKFQKDNSLTVTGTTTKETWDKFLAKDAELKATVTPDIPKNIEKALIKVKDIDTAAGDLVAGEDVSQTASTRAQELSKETGIPAAVIYAIEKRESAGNPKAFAWNAHIARRNSKIPSKLPSGKSYYGNNAIKQFSRAYKVDPTAAIAGGAWGLYQVLGAWSLQDYGKDPKKFMAAWDSNPEAHSKLAFKTWINKNPTAAKLMKSGNTAGWVGKYYGEKNPDYIAHVTKNINAYNSAYSNTATV